MPVVTIRGLMGSGAPEIGRQVAERLHLDYIDREIIAEVAARLRRQEHELIAKEMPPASLKGRIAKALERSFVIGVGPEAAYLPAWQIPLDDARYLQSLKSVIRELAANRSMVIYGRGSQFILKDYPHALHVSVVAPLPVRIRRVVETQKLDENRARQEVARFDSSGREFIKRYFLAEPEDSANYDLVINTEHLSFDAAVSIIIHALSFEDQSAGGQAPTA